MIHDQCSLRPRYRGFFHGVSEIIREQGESGTSAPRVHSYRDVWHSKTHVGISAGVRGTYQGLTATVLKQGSNQAIRFYVMNLLRNWYKGGRTSRPPFILSSSLLPLPSSAPTTLLVPQRRRPEERNAPHRHGNVWSHGGSRQRLWQHAAGCGEDKDAGGKRNLGCWAVWDQHHWLVSQKELRDFPVQGLEAHRYKNTVDCAFQILKHEGPQA